jgi:hypothetical protein
MELEHGKSSCENIEGNIIKEAHAPPKFEIVKQNKLLHDAKRDLEEDREHREIQCTIQMSLEEECVHEEVHRTTHR